MNLRNVLNKNGINEPYKIENGYIIFESNRPSIELNSLLEECSREKRIAEIKKQLDEIDAKTIRPMRAGETERVLELEANAQTLRNELASLQEEN